MLDFPFDFGLLIVVGFIVGIINTLAGGGSLITLPLLIFLGLPTQVANGTNRIAILFYTSSATLGFRTKKVNTFPFSIYICLLYTSPSPRDLDLSRMPSSA